MTPNDPNYLASVFGRSGEEIRVQKQQSFESRVVAAILTFYGLSAAEAKRQAGGRVSTEWFRQTYPNFPVRMFAEKVAKTAGTHIGYNLLFGNTFAKLPWLKAFQESTAAADVSLDRDVACFVFNSPHTAGGTLLCIHNAASSPDNVVLAPGETRIVRQFGPNNLTLVIESLQGFLLRVGRQWLEAAV